MPIYEYKALDDKGRKIKGLIDSDSEAQAKSQLRAKSIYLTNLKAGRARKAKHVYAEVGVNLFDRVKSEEVNVVTRQLATLLGAGIPLVPAISSLVEQTERAALKKVLVQIREFVNEGGSLTNALGEHENLFSNVYINMIRAGEASGSLNIVLERLADFGEKQQALNSRMLSALIYPIFMALIGSVILIILITYIVPNITQVFEEMDKVLPAPTLFLIWVSDFLKHYWWLFLIILLFTVFALRSFVRRPVGRKVLDYIKLKIPIIGKVNQKVILARFSSTLGSLLNSGVDLMTSIKIVKALTNNVCIARVLDESMVNIEKGKSMTLSLSNSPWFPPMFVQMISVGEQSGSLEKMLSKVSEAYEREVENSILAMTSLIEPIMIALMGTAVGVIVLSILLPIFEMNQMVG